MQGGETGQSITAADYDVITNFLDNFYLEAAEEIKHDHGIRWGSFADDKGLVCCKNVATSKWIQRAISCCPSELDFKVWTVRDEAVDSRTVGKHMIKIFPKVHFRTKTDVWFQKALDTHNKDWLEGKRLDLIYTKLSATRRS